MNVLLIPEDFRHDQYILGPLFSGIMNICGRPNAKVRVCLDPLLGGVAEATNPERLNEIVERYDGMVDIFILCVDRDAEQGRKASLNTLEKQFGVGRNFFCVAAIEELETWLLAGCDLPKDWSWKNIREEKDPKERYFLPYARMLNVEFSPGQGRRSLGKLLKGNVARVVQRCPEELDELIAKIRTSLN